MGKAQKVEPDDGLSDSDRGALRKMGEAYLFIEFPDDETLRDVYVDKAIDPECGYDPEHDRYFVVLRSSTGYKTRPRYFPGLDFAILKERYVD